MRQKLVELLRWIAAYLIAIPIVIASLLRGEARKDEPRQSSDGSNAASTQFIEACITIADDPFASSRLMRLALKGAFDRALEMQVRNQEETTERDRALRMVGYVLLDRGMMKRAEELAMEIKDPNLKALLQRDIDRRRE